MQKIGIVGAGFMGKMHAQVYQGLAGAELMGVYDHGKARAIPYAEQFGIKVFDSLEDLAKECTVVDICTPTDTHAELAIAGAKLGLHVISEKPMARTLEEAEAMTKACSDAGVKLFIAHCIRFWPEYVKLKELVDSKELGELLSVNLTRYGGFPAWSSDQWLRAEVRAGGGVLDMHIHDTDYILYLLGEPETMDTWGSVDEKGPGHVFTTMTYRSGKTIAHLEGGWNLPTGSPFKMAFRAVFENGAAIWDAGPLGIYRPETEPEFPEFKKMAAEGGGNLSDLGGYSAELAEFMDCLNTGRECTVVTPQTSLKSLEYTLKEIDQIKAKL